MPEAGTPNPRIRKVLGLNGLRGIAVLAVVIYHFFEDALPGGFMGVDMFFVLSGFLITALLVREHAATGRVSLKNFWIRRLRRIVPAAVSVVLIVTAVVGLIGGDIAVGLPAQFFSSLFFVNNWMQIAQSQSYFANADLRVFAHYWSLAVEEQFYIIFPLLFVALRRWMLAATSLGVFASAAWMWALYKPDVDPSRVYFGTDTHAFGLLIGATLALLCTSKIPTAPDSWPRRLGNAASGVVFFGATAGLFAMLFLVADTEPFTYRGGMVLASALFAIMIWVALSEAPSITWFTQWAPLRWFGDRSFSLYLWHWPVIVILRHLYPQQPHWILGVAGLAIALPLSEFSYRFIEQPMHRNGYLATLALGIKSVFKGQLAGYTRASIAWLVGVVALLGSVHALASAPTHTEFEERMATLAAANAARATEAPAPTTTRAPLESLPTGDQITAVGDSVMLAASPALYERFPGIYVDAAVSRAMISMPTIIEGLKASGSLRPFVFIGAGTNSALDDSVIDALVAAIGDDHTIVITNPYGDRTWIPVSRAALQEAVERHQNVYVANWCEQVVGNPSVVATDGIHPDVQGAEMYVDAFTAALKQWQQKKKVVPGPCG